MIEVTKAEQKALLTLYKDFTVYYNANSLSKKLGITQVGAMKLLKRLEKNKIVLSRRIGKSIIYKVNVEEELIQRLLAFTLANEAKKYERWAHEFKPLGKKGRIVLFYGSASRNYAPAKDIDVMIVLDKNDASDVHSSLNAVQKFLSKKLHPLIATRNDLFKNLQEHNEAMTEIIKTAIVLYGYDEYMEIVNGFTGF